MPAYSYLLDEERDQIAIMRAAGHSGSRPSTPSSIASQGRGPLALSDAPPQTLSSAPIEVFARYYQGSRFHPPTAKEHRRQDRGRPLGGRPHHLQAHAAGACAARVENANGRLRRWLPRHIDIDRLSDEEIQDIVITANLTPRKCLRFKTPSRRSSKSLAKTPKSASLEPVRFAPESTA
jgi:hypothetical protein